MSICTLGWAIDKTGAKTTNVKINILKINFLIGFPPFILVKKFIENNKCSTSYLTLLTALPLFINWQLLVNHFQC
jgi:hypothetical protein